MKKKSAILALLLASTTLAIGACSKNSGGQDDPTPITPEVVSVTSVSLDKQTASLEEGETVKLVATVSPSNATNKNVSFSSSDENVATVASDGTVSAIKKGTATITVTTADGAKTASCVVTVNLNAELEAAREAGRKTVREAFNKLDVEDYSKSKWNEIVNKLNNSITSIDSATSSSTINTIVSGATTFFESAVKKSDVTKGTWFDYVSSDSNYEFDRDSENHIVVTYDGNPGHWVHIGTKSNLHTDVTKNNLISITLRNDIEEEIEVCFQIIATNGEKIGDTGITKIAGQATKELTLPYDIEINKLYLFLDSCNDAHNRKGHVTIMDYGLSYEKREPEMIPDPKTVDVGKSMTKDDEGSQTVYTLTEADQPAYIERVSALVEVDYQGNGDSGHYFGLYLNAGTNKIVVKEADGYAQDMKVDSVKVGERFIFNLPISGKMYKGAEIKMSIQYAAGPSDDHPELKDIKFKVVSYTFYYTLWRNIESETVDVNTEVYTNSTASNTATIKYSDFQKKGRVSKMTVNFTTINEASYGKSQLHFTNFQFTNFSSGNNNVLNIGAKMDKKNSEPVTGSMDLYPTVKIDLNKDAEIAIECWWASAKMIRIDSVTMYTDNMEKPEAVTNLEAHSIDSGVVLEWAPSALATSYDVYMDDVLQTNVKASYATIEGLTNGESHEFKVVAKNSSGEAEAVKVTGSAEEGAEYDTFIQGLNTELEQTLGQEKVSGVLAASNFYETSSDYVINNERLVNAINKMKNGEETTVAYMGGSITVGEGAELKDENNHKKGYAYYSYQWMKRNYDVQSKSRFVNGSISGTGSEIGAVRLKKDILDYNPDIIFIEFAANNGSTEFDNSTYESLIRRCQALPNDPAIILTFSYTYYSNYESGTEKRMSEIGEYYNLPMVSIARGMSTVVEHADKERTDPIYKMFSSDGTHPSDDGHQMYGKAIAYFIKSVIGREKDAHYDYPSAPSSTGYDRWDNFVTVDHNLNDECVTSLGSFVEANTATPCTSEQSDVTAFRQGWKKTDTTANEPMTIEVNAKNFILIYEAGNPSVSGDPTGNIIVSYQSKNDPTDQGQLTWDVTKTCKQNTSGSMEIDASGNGWQNPCAIRIIDNSLADDYIISIQMENASGICTIMAFGYCA